MDFGYGTMHLMGLGLQLQQTRTSTTAASVAAAVALPDLQLHSFCNLIACTSFVLAAAGV
jgi:hypothetical protein